VYIRSRRVEWRVVIRATRFSPHETSRFVYYRIAPRVATRHGSRKSAVVRMIVRIIQQVRTIHRPFAIDRVSRLRNYERAAGNCLKQTFARESFIWNVTSSEKWELLQFYPRYPASDDSFVDAWVWLRTYTVKNVMKSHEFLIYTIKNFMKFNVLLSYTICIWFHDIKFNVFVTEKYICVHVHEI